MKHGRAWTPKENERHLKTCPDKEHYEITAFGDTERHYHETCMCGEAAKHTPQAEINQHTPPAL